MASLDSGHLKSYLSDVKIDDARKLLLFARLDRVSGLRDVVVEMRDTLIDSVETLIVEDDVEPKGISGQIQPVQPLQYNDRGHVLYSNDTWGPLPVDTESPIRRNSKGHYLHSDGTWGVHPEL